VFRDGPPLCRATLEQIFMKIVQLFVTLLAAGTAQAAPVAPKSAVAAAPAAAAQPPAAKRFPGVSDAGNAILAKAQATPDPQLQAIGRQSKAAHDQLVSAVMAPVIDLDKVTAAMRAEEAVQAQLRTHSNDRLLAVLKQLSSDDRDTFLRTLVLARQTRAPNGPPPVAPPIAANPQP
jgi:uncharacterized membrane protein